MDDYFQCWIIFEDNFIISISVKLRKILNLLKQKAQNSWEWRCFFFSPLRTTCIVYCGVTRNSEPTTYTNPKLETSHRTKSSTQKSGLGAQLSYRHTHYGSINMDIGLQSITSLFSFYKPSLFQKGFRWLRMDFSCGNVWWRLVKSIRWLEASKSWGWMVILLHYLLDIIRLCSCFKIKKKKSKRCFPAKRLLLIRYSMSIIPYFDVSFPYLFLQYSVKQLPISVKGEVISMF